MATDEYTTDSIYVGKLPNDCTQEDVQAEFSKFGEIIKLTFPRGRGDRANKGFAYVQYANENDARNVFRGGNIYVLNELCVVERKKISTRRDSGEPDAPPELAADTIYVGELPENASEDDVHATFGRYGEISKVTMPTRYDKETQDRVSRGFAYVKFAVEQDAQKVFRAIDKSQAFHCANSQVTVERKKVFPKRNRSPRKTSPRSPRKQLTEDDLKDSIYVGNLPEDTTQDDLQDCFGDYGEILKVTVPTRYDRKRDERIAKGFGYVRFATEQTAAKVLRALGQKTFYVADQEVTVEARKPREPREAKSPRASNEKTAAGKNWERLYKVQKKRADNLKRIMGILNKQIEDLGGEPYRAERANSPRRGDSGPTAI